MTSAVEQELRDRRNDLRAQLYLLDYKQRTEARRLLREVRKVLRNYEPNDLVGIGSRARRAKHLREKMENLIELGHLLEQAQADAEKPSSGGPRSFLAESTRDYFRRP